MIIVGCTFVHIIFLLINANWLLQHILIIVLKKSTLLKQIIEDTINIIRKNIISQNTYACV